MTPCADCRWTTYGTTPLMVVRDPACATHGDGTAWWAGVVRRARALAGAGQA